MKRDQRKNKRIEDTYICVDVDGACFVCISMSASQTNGTQISVDKERKRWSFVKNRLCLRMFVLFIYRQYILHIRALWWI